MRGQRPVPLRIAKCLMILMVSFFQIARAKGEDDSQFSCVFLGVETTSQLVCAWYPHLLLPSRQPVLLGNQPHIVRDFAHV